MKAGLCGQFNEQEKTLRKKDLEKEKYSGLMRELKKKRIQLKKEQIKDSERKN